MLFRERIAFPEPTSLQRPENHALYITLLSEVWRFEDPENPLAYGHRENVWDHTKSCIRRAKHYMEKCPHVVEQFEARYPGYSIENDMVDMLFIHEAGEFFAGDVPKTNSGKMAIKERIKEKEHLAAEQFVVPQFAPQERARMLDLYRRFEMHSPDDVLAQVARLCDNEDGNMTALYYRVSPCREVKSPSSTQLEVTNSLGWLLTPGAAIYQHLSGDKAKREHLAYLRENIHFFLDEGLEDEVAQALVPQEGQQPKLWQNVLQDKLLPTKSERVWRKTRRTLATATLQLLGAIGVAS